MRNASKCSENQIITRATEKALIPLICQINGLVRRFADRTTADVTSSPSPSSSSTSIRRVPQSIRTSSIRLTNRIDAFCGVATGLHPPPPLRPPLCAAILDARSAAARLEEIMDSLSRVPSENSPEYSDDYRMTTSGSPPLGEIEGVADKLLSSLTLILATSDQILVENVKNALILVQRSLDELYACKSFPAFIPIFGTFGNHMITLGHVTSPTRLDLKDVRKRCYLEMSRNVLETSTQLVLNSFKMTLRSPTCPRTLTLKNLTYDYVTRALALIYKIVDLNDIEFAKCRDVHCLAVNQSVRQLVDDFRAMIEEGTGERWPFKIIARNLEICVRVFTDSNGVGDKDRMTIKLSFDSFRNNLNLALLNLEEGNENGDQGMFLDDASIMKCLEDLHELKITMDLVCHKMAAKLSKIRPALDHVIATLRNHVTRAETAHQSRDQVPQWPNQLSTYLEQRVELLQLMAIVGGSCAKDEQIYDSFLGICGSENSGQTTNTQQNMAFDGVLRREAKLNNELNIATFCQRAIPLTMNICLNAAVTTAFEYTAGEVGKSPNHVEICTQTLDILLKLYYRHGSADLKSKMADKSCDGRYQSLPRRGKHGSSDRQRPKLTINGNCYHYLQQNCGEDNRHKNFFNENYV